MYILWLCVFAQLVMVFGQRGSFAGNRPIGYPELYDSTSSDPLANRFGEKDGTTQRLPIEALGDKNLVDRLSKLPADQQPFWLLNWQALEANRQKPQSYPQKPISFVGPDLSSFPQSGETATRTGPTLGQASQSFPSQSFSAQSSWASQSQFSQTFTSAPIRRTTIKEVPVFIRGGGLSDPKESTNYKQEKKTTEKIPLFKRDDENYDDTDGYYYSRHL